MKTVELGTKGPLMVFLHGWPDSPSVWEAQFSHFSERYRCVALQLPLHEDPGASPITRAPFGPTFAQLDVMVEEAIESKRQGDEKIILVCHDWGTELAYRYERRFPERVSKIVGMDISPFTPSPGELGIKAILYVIFYQWWLILAYTIWHWVPVIGQPVGNWMTTWMARFARAPTSRTRTYYACMNYFYVNFWLQKVLGHAKRPSCDRLRYPKAPFLFIYGKRKLFNFHRASIVNEPGIKVVGFDTDHWIMRKSEALNAEIDAFLQTK